MPYAFRFPLPALVVAALLLFTACDSSGGNDTDPEPSPLDNAFSLTVTDDGGGSRTLDGFAYFATGTDPETNVAGFVLYFVDDEDFSQGGATDGLFGVAVRKSGRPGTGQYVVSNTGDDFDTGGAFAMILYENISSSAATVYEISGGSLDITRSESARIDGSLSLQATAFNITTGGEPSESVVTIEGSFQSPGVDSFFGTTFLP